jgi:hypothetical protein
MPYAQSVVCTKKPKPAHSVTKRNAVIEATALAQGAVMALATLRASGVSKLSPIAAATCRHCPAKRLILLVSDPANREFYREFCKIAVSGAPETVNNGVVTGLLIRIPYSTEQGIILAEQGILAREQGILSAKTEIIVG